MPEDKKPLHHNLADASGSEANKEDLTATAILRRKKKDNGMPIINHINPYKN